MSTMFYEPNGSKKQRTNKRKRERATTQCFAPFFLGLLAFFCACVKSSNILVCSISSFNSSNSGSGYFFLACSNAKDMLVTIGRG